MKIDIKVPQAGESVTEAMISEWFKQDGDHVEKDEAVLELETDKANMELNADESGVLSIGVAEGEVVTVGQVIGTIDTKASGAPSSADEKESETAQETAETEKPKKEKTDSQPLAPSVRRIVAEENLDPDQISGSGKDGRILKEDALKAAKENKNTADSQPKAEPAAGKDEKPPSESKQTPPKQTTPPTTAQGEREERTVPMSMMRRRIAQRLVEAQQTAAILTTFNEVDMSAVMELRSRYKDDFAKKYGIKLGFMSFFVKACVEALKQVPEINATIEGNQITYRDYYDVGVAVGSQKGLVVPIVRDSDRLSFAQLEQAIGDYAVKAREGKISLEDLSGGTFTISNGGHLWIAAFHPYSQPSPKRHSGYAQN